MEIYNHVKNSRAYLISARKQWLSSMHFHQDTTQTPHIDSQIIGDAQEHLRWAIKSWLYILINLEEI